MSNGSFRVRKEHRSQFFPSLGDPNELLQDTMAPVSLFEKYLPLLVSV
jgi:hypothetical protein